MLTQCNPVSFFQLLERRVMGLQNLKYHPVPVFLQPEQVSFSIFCTSVYDFFSVWKLLKIISSLKVHEYFIEQAVFHCHNEILLHSCHETRQIFVFVNNLYNGWGVGVKHSNFGSWKTCVSISTACERGTRIF